MGARRACSVGLLLAALFVLSPPRGSAYSDGPPPAHTGGFGEPTCAACHVPAAEPARGRLRVEGVPERYRPGERYRLTVVLEDPGLERAGFELAVRTAAGALAGSLKAADERAEVVPGPEGAIEYARQTVRGVVPVAAHRATWTLVWTAPEAPPADAAAPPEVHFHAAGNAANYDASEFGDTPYTIETVAVGAGPP